MPERAPKVTPETMAQLAAGLGIDIPDGLRVTMAERLQASLEAAAELRQLDLTDIAPAAVFTMQRWR